MMKTKGTIRCRDAPAIKTVYYPNKPMVLVVDPSRHSHGKMTFHLLYHNKG
jgi:hypothetical protein